MKVFYGKIFSSDLVQNHWPDFCHLVCQMSYHTKVAFFFVDFAHLLHIRGLVYRDICSTISSPFECVRLPRFKVQFLCSYSSKTLETQVRSKFEFSVPFSQSCPLHYMILLIQLFDRFYFDWACSKSLMLINHEVFWDVIQSWLFTHRVIPCFSNNLDLHSWPC